MSFMDNIQVNDFDFKINGFVYVRLCGLSINPRQTLHFQVNRIRFQKSKINHFNATFQNPRRVYMMVISGYIIFFPALLPSARVVNFYLFILVCVNRLFGRGCWRAKNPLEPCSGAQLTLQYRVRVWHWFCGPPVQVCCWLFIPVSGCGADSSVRRLVCCWLIGIVLELNLKCYSPCRKCSTEKNEWAQYSAEKANVLFH